jgi:hypothetical protein
MLVLLVGVDHRIQYTNLACSPKWRQEILKFANYLKDQCQQHGVQLLAEEFSEEALLSSNATGCTVCDVATELGLPHLFCDPTQSERNTLNVTTSDQREQVWLDRLLSAKKDNILFVCGDDHINTFSTKLMVSDFQIQVLSRQWGKNWPMID